MRSERKLPALLFGAVICLASFCVGADAPATHVRNFDRVNNHLFRGGEPSLVGLTELGAMGVKLDIDLREPSANTQVEKQAAEKLGIKYIEIPMRPFSAPSQKEIEQALSLILQNTSSTVYVHCRRGKDRTGTVIACYRIQHDHWDNRTALAEAKRHGMSFTERGMQAYILHFKPLSMTPQILPAVP